MFLVKCEPKCPIIDVDQLDAHITDIIENGFGSTAVSCLVLLVFALASIWGNYPNDERRHVASTGAGPGTEYTVAVPEHRAKESWIYFAMAQRLMPMASMDDSLLGVTCFCLFGLHISHGNYATTRTNTSVGHGIATTSNPFKHGRCSGPHPCYGRHII